jgi:hypothetical protein
MNWYRKAANTEKLNWDTIHSDFDYHVKQILEGKKPAGHFDVQINTEINHANYPKVFDFIRYVKKNRPDLDIYDTLQTQRDGYKVRAYVIGQPQACLNIIDGIKRLAYQGSEDEQGHRSFGKGVGYTQEEINEFVKNRKNDDVQKELKEIWDKESKEVEPNLVVKKI